MALNHFHPLNPDISIYILLTFLCAISCDTDKENLFNNQSFSGW